MSRGEFGLTALQQGDGVNQVLVKEVKPELLS